MAPAGARDNTDEDVGADVALDVDADDDEGQELRLVMGIVGGPFARAPWGALLHIVTRAKDLCFTSS